jgi:VWFA-related protein
MRILASGVTMLCCIKWWRTLVTALVLLSLFKPLNLSAGSEYQSSAQSSTSVEQSNTVLHTNTRLVVVDVVATKKGIQAAELKAEDFTLLEDGKPQKISGFTFQDANAVKITQLPQLPENIVTNTPRFQSNSLNVILFDTVNGDLAEHAYAKDQLLKFLNTAELSRPVAIFALQTGIKMLHDFTTDNKALSAAVAKYQPPAQGITSESMESRASVFTTRGDYHTNERGIETTLNQLNVLAKMLKGYPGRKNLIWLSESFPLTLFPETDNQGHMDGQSLRSATQGRFVSEGLQTNSLSTEQNLPGKASANSYAALVKKVADALMAAQVAVYPVDAGAIGKDDRLASQHTMETMAQQTGGKTFKNSNNLLLGLQSSIEDGSTYYTLEYYPDNKNWDGQFRTIQLKANQPGVSLRYREGYYALDPEKVNKENADAIAESFSRSLQLDAPAATGLLFQAQVLAPSEKSKKVVVSFHVDPRTIAFEHKEGGLESAKVSCAVWAYGKDRGKPTMSSGTVNANLKPGEYQQIMQQHFLPCGQELELKAGTYTLRMGVLDRTTNRMGTASAQVIVP